jgi:hypothetical protein
MLIKIPASASSRLGDADPRRRRHQVGQLRGEHAVVVDVEVADSIVGADAGQSHCRGLFFAWVGDQRDLLPMSAIMPAVSANRPSKPTLTDPRRCPAAKSCTDRASSTRTPARTCETLPAMSPSDDPQARYGKTLANGFE